MQTLHGIRIQHYDHRTERKKIGFAAVERFLILIQLIEPI